MVLRSQRDGLGSSSQAPRGRTSGTRGDIDVPAVGQWSPGARLEKQSVSKWGLSVWCNTHLAPRLGRGRGRRHRVLGPDPVAHWRRERGMGMWRRGLAHCHPRPLGTRRKRKLLLWSFGYHWPGGQWRNRTKILHPALLRGKEWCYRHLLKSRIPRLRVARPRDAAYPGTSQAWQGRRRATPLSCGQLHAAAIVKAAVVAELERRWRPQKGAFGDEQAEGLQPAVGWRQQRTAGAGCETPPSASVRRRTVGQSPPPLRRIGRPGRSGSPGSGACRTPSYPPRSATGGAPGPLMWTSSDPGPAPWLSSPLARGPSLCSVPATHLGQHHPRAAVSTPWPGGPAGGPWRAGRKRPVQQHRKPWPLERTRTYRPRTEGVDYPSRRQRPAGKAAWQWRARLGGPPHTPGPLCRRGWWGRRRH